ncbi:secreted protein [Minicystis rosea]|nr:secreted protein [Minicystis rosea]
MEDTLPPTKGHDATALRYRDVIPSDEASLFQDGYRLSPGLIDGAAWGRDWIHRDPSWSAMEPPRGGRASAKCAIVQTSLPGTPVAAQSARADHLPSLDSPRRHRARCLCASQHRNRAGRGRRRRERGRERLADRGDDAHRHHRRESPQDRLDLGHDPRCRARRRQGHRGRREPAKRLLQRQIRWSRGLELRHVLQARSVEQLVIVIEQQQLVIVIEQQQLVGGSATVTPAEILAALGSCKQLAGTTSFRKDSGGSKSVPICSIPGAVWWTADLDVDCDGGKGAACKADPYYQAETAATDSKGNPLDASTLPYVVIPMASNGFDYKQAGLKLGSVVAVIYGGKISYGILGDVGPAGVIGEASYAMAKELGINPSPTVGGVDSGVTYVAFTGTSAVVSKKEDHAAAVTIGQQKAADLVDAQ